MASHAIYKTISIDKATASSFAGAMSMSEMSSCTGLGCPHGAQNSLERRCPGHVLRCAASKHHTTQLQRRGPITVCCDCPKPFFSPCWEEEALHVHQSLPIPRKPLGVLDTQHDQADSIWPPLFTSFGGRSLYMSTNLANGSNTNRYIKETSKSVGYRAPTLRGKLPPLWPSFLLFRL